VPQKYNVYHQFAKSQQDFFAHQIVGLVMLVDDDRVCSSFDVLQKLESLSAMLNSFTK